jgi:hypothetical protein
MEARMEDRSDNRKKSSMAGFISSAAMTPISRHSSESWNPAFVKNLDASFRWHDDTG